MERIVAGEFREAIAHALGVIPAPIAARLRHVEFLTGTDPVYAGLHSYAVTADGRSYARMAHCAYPTHTFDRSTTIVLPVPEDPWVIVHEMGHALHETLGFRPAPQPVTAYARTNHFEAFAEAFVAHLYAYGNQDVWWRDEETRSLFDRLAQGDDL